MDILKVKNKEELYELKVKKGTVAYCEEENIHYIYNKEWFPTDFNEIEDNEAKLNLYQLNKSKIKTMSTFTETQWNKAESLFTEWYELNKHNYYMLYGKYCSYFTLFKRKRSGGEFKSLFEGIKKCIDNFGEVYSFDVTEDGAAIEIWASIDDDIDCFYFFNYDEGVVTFNE